jgi:hypothetical protein
MTTLHAHMKESPESLSGSSTRLLRSPLRRLLLLLCSLQIHVLFCRFVPRLTSSSLANRFLLCWKPIVVLNPQNSAAPDALAIPLIRLIALIRRRNRCAYACGGVNCHYQLLCSVFFFPLLCRRLVFTSFSSYCY